MFYFNADRFEDEWSNGLMVLRKEKEYYIFSMETFTKAILIKIHLMDMECIHFLMEINMKESFYKASSMEEEYILMFELVVIKENGLMDAKKEKEF
jgi:hypothetical protein